MFANCKNLESIEIPNGVKYIGTEAFGQCKKLSLLDGKLPDSLETIGTHAFWYCDNLYSVHIPSKVTSIEYCPFVGCKNLSAIEVDAGNENYCSEDGVLYNKDKTELICYPDAKEVETFTIPNTVEIIDEYAFFAWQTPHLKSLTIPSSVTSIGAYAFLFINTLQSITFENLENWYYVENETDWKNKQNGTKVTDTSTFTVINFRSGKGEKDYGFYGPKYLYRLDESGGGN